MLNEVETSITKKFISNTTVMEDQLNGEDNGISLEDDHIVIDIDKYSPELIIRRPEGGKFIYQHAEVIVNHTK